MCVLGVLAGGFHADDSVTADRGAMRGLWREIQSITGLHRNVTAGNMEDDRSLDTEQHLVIRMLVFRVSVTGLVRPCAGFETLGPERLRRRRPCVGAHR